MLHCCLDDEIKMCKSPAGPSLSPALPDRAEVGSVIMWLNRAIADIDALL